MRNLLKVWEGDDGDVTVETEAESPRMLLATITVAIHSTIKTLRAGGAAEDEAKLMVLIAAKMGADLPPEIEELLDAETGHGPNG